MSQRFYHRQFVSPIVISIFTLFISVLFFFNRPAGAQSVSHGILSANMKFVPQGEFTQLSIQAKSVTNAFDRMSFEVSYDPTVLEATACSFSSPFIGECNIDFDKNNIGSDVIRFSLVTLQTLTNDFQIATVTFQAIGPNGARSDAAVTIDTIARGTTPLSYSAEKGSVTISNTAPLALQFSGERTNRSPLVLAWLFVASVITVTLIVTFRRKKLAGSWWLLLFLAGSFVWMNHANASIAAFNAPVSALKGDVNCDNQIPTTEDARHILRWVSQFPMRVVGYCPTTTSADLLLLNVCDVNSDNQCDTLDALYVVQCEASILNVYCPVLPFPTSVPPTNTPVPTATTINTTAVPTAIPTAIVVTPFPTSTPLPTNTPVPPTKTPLPTPTKTATPRPTNTPVPVPTNTSVPVPTNTSVPAPTNTPVPAPTNMPTNTPVPVPTNTPVPAPTNTSVPAPTNTSVPLPTNTNTPIPLPTSTNTPFPTIIPTTRPGITVHYKGWSNPNIYAWLSSGSTVTNLRGAWPGTAMTAEANGWYTDYFADQTTINLIFNSGGSQTPDLTRTTGEWWYQNGVWTAYNPDAPSPTATPIAVVPTATSNPSATATPTPSGSGITLHYKGWTSPNIYAWIVSGGTTTPLSGAWPGNPMSAESGGWYGVSFPTQSSINLIFNSSGSQTGDLTRTTGEWWYLNGVWYASNPEDTVAPAINITSPTGGSVSGVVPITVNATDNNGVTKVEFLLDGVKIGESTTAPFTYNWTTTTSCGGAHVLTAIAYDGASNSTTSPAVNVTLGNANQPPVANAGSDFSVPANISAQFNGSASTDDCGVVTYSWSNGLTGVNPLKMYSTPGTYNVILTVTDAAGLSDTDEVVLTVVEPSLRGDFREETIYFLITTRFFDGDPSNNLYSWDSRFGLPNNDPEWRGDFKGLGAKLDYIKALGFSAIWITPVVKNMSGYDYHGYHAVNFKQVDSRYESADYDYQRLINEAHAHGIKVIQDVVFNHTGNFGEENLYPMFTKDPTKPDTADNMVNIAPPGRLPDNYATLLPSAQYAARINAMKEDSIDTGNIYHHEKSLSWESYTVQTGQIAGDAVDLNTENPVVYNYLIDAYNQYIDMGVDAFRVDTVKHISRLTFNKTFNPAFKARGGQNFFMFGEIAARYRNVWNSGIPAISVPFYTWAESKSYGWSDTDWKVNKGLVEQNWADNLDTGTQPTSNNHLLNGNTYHAPDRSKSSGLDVIDFPMHWSFVSAGEAFGIAVGGDQYYNDATWNVTYVDSHDYAPDTAPEGQRFAQPQDTWAENLSLMFTFRGIPTIYYGSEIEFKKGKEIDKGPTIALEDSGRAYFGANLEGSVTTTGYGVYSNATGQMATTLSHPLAQHIRRLNLIRRAVPALQKGQYSREGVSGSLAFKRRYTANGVDSFALVTISGNSTFSGIPGGTYVDAITGGSITVAEGGTLTASVSGKGNMRVYVLNGPGKIGVDGTYLK